MLLLLRMLALGLRAWDLIESQVFTEARLDSQLVTKFLPALLSLMVDDQVRNLQSKFPPDERETAITVIEHSGEITNIKIQQPSQNQYKKLYIVSRELPTIQVF